MAVDFTRQLGSEPGVQLNPLRDNSSIPVQDNADQLFGIIMRSTRGRIDKSFKVNSGNVFNKLGKGETIRVSALNEAWVHVIEALNNGAYEAVVQRLVTESAAISYAVAYLGLGAVLTPVLGTDDVASVTVTNGGTGYADGQAITFTGDGTGATGTVTVVDGVITAVTVTSGGSGYSGAPTATITDPISFAVSAALPAIPYLFAVKHLECHNDGIKIEFRADEKRESGSNVPNDKITISIKDSDGGSLYEVTGSLNPAALDDFGSSYFLDDIALFLTDDAIEITVGAITEVGVDLPLYGYDSNGLPKWSKSDVLLCFSEGGTAYTSNDYVNARSSLQYSPFNYSYISSGGSQSVALLAQLAQLAFDTNRQLRFDIPGNLTPDAAITFVEQLNFSVSEHLLHAYWSPLQSNDPTGVNGKRFFGIATLNIAYACRRNAQTNAKGFALKNFPIAGKAWPINRTGITQQYTPTDQELSALARGKVNPCLFETYTGGGRYVFLDSITSARVESSLKKLISVADMSTSIDTAVTQFGNDIIQLPMDIAIKRARDYLSFLFEGAQSSGWLVPSDDPFMKGAAFKYEVKPNEARPYDRVDINYWIRYDGTVRQIFVTQTLTR